MQFKNCFEESRVYIYYLDFCKSLWRASGEQCRAPVISAQISWLLCSQNHLSGHPSTTAEAGTKLLWDIALKKPKSCPDVSAQGKVIAPFKCNRSDRKWCGWSWDVSPQPRFPPRRHSLLGDLLYKVAAGEGRNRSQSVWYFSASNLYCLGAFWRHFSRSASDGLL